MHAVGLQADSSQAPMLEAVEYEWQYWDVLSPSSKYIGTPSQEIEKEWDYLWQCKIFF